MKHFWDLDGFMFDFDGFFEDRFGVSAYAFENNKKEMWRLIKDYKTFFLDLPLKPGAMAFYQQYKHLNPMFLTSCPHSDYEDVASQKRKAVYRHFGKNNLVLPTHGSEAKPFFMHQPGDVLIDDWGKNIRAWVDAGGFGIKHEGNDFETTAHVLDWVLHRENEHVS